MTLPTGLGAIIAIVVLIVAVVLAVLQGPSLVLGLIAALAISRLC